MALQNNMTQDHCELTTELPGDPGGVENLTGREREVLVRVGTGAGNREIARTLGIAERTVKAHLTHIMGKIGVASRLEAALFAYARHELVCPQVGCRRHL
ncbi:response regulator transcription factor [Streptomyces sp. NPDC054863]